MAEIQEKARIVLISIDGMAHYYWQDARLRMPNLRKLAGRGAEAVEGMESVFPTATWAIHTSMVTGCYPRKHGVLGNWAVDREAGKVAEFFADRFGSKESFVRRQTIYDKAKEAGWTTASICWPVTRGASSLDDNIPEFYEQELFEEHATPSLWKELRLAGLPVGSYAEWSRDHARGAMQDSLTADIALHLIRTRQPQLLMLHFLLPDSLQHDYGTRSPEAFWSLEYVDEQIGRVLEALKEQDLLESTNVFVVSDHGFVDTDRTFYPNALLRELGWLDTEQPARSKALAVSNGGSGYVYLLEEDPEEKALMLLKLEQQLEATGVIARMFRAEQFAELGLPAEGEMDRFRPDLAFEVKLNTFVHFDATEEQVVKQLTKFKGMHGYLPDHEDLRAIFVAAGPDIKPQTKLPLIRMVDVAPTFMRLIGGELPDVDGRPIDALWREEAQAWKHPSGFRPLK